MFKLALACFAAVIALVVPVAIGALAARAGTSAQASFPGLNGAIAYTVWGGWTDADLCVMKPDGSRQRRLTRGPTFDVGPAWTAQGDRLAFARAVRWEPGTRSSIRVLTVKGGQRAVKLGAEYNAVFPTWSPDGHQIAFSTFPPHFASDVFVVAARGGRPRVVTLGSHPDWSPDGTRLAYTGERGVTVANADGTGARIIAPGYDPSWSPDGHQIAFETIVRVGGRDVEVVSVANTDGSNVTQLTTGPYSDMAPAWSPDGKRIVFVRGDSYITGDLWVMNADGTDERRLTRTPFGEAHPTWRSVGPNQQLGLSQACAASTVGSARSETMRGTSGDDAIYGLAGNDSLFGGGGRDFLSGGPGADRIAARDGAGDEIVCGSGRDVVVADGATASAATASASAAARRSLRRARRGSRLDGTPAC